MLPRVSSVGVGVSVGNRVVLRQTVLIVDFPKL